MSYLYIEPTRRILMKKTILIDLDGVLNTYDGNFNKDYIPLVKDGAKEFLEKLSKNYEIKIFTTRNKLLTSKWVIENNLDKYILDITNIKDLAWIYIDDRCLTFKGNYESLTAEINNFRPWYK